MLSRFAVALRVNAMLKNENLKTIAYINEVRLFVGFRAEASIPFLSKQLDSFGFPSTTYKPAERRMKRKTTR